MDYLEIRELYHHGIKGQRWGIRRFQNEDGSLTAEGKQRYGYDESSGKMSKEGKKLFKSDIKTTRKEISKDYSNIYKKNYENNRKLLYGNKHWTNLTNEEQSKISAFASRDTSQELMKKYGERSLKDFTAHNKQMKAGIAAAGSVLAIIGTVAVATYVMKDTGADKALGKAGGKVLDNLGKAAFR